MSDAAKLGLHLFLCSVVVCAARSRKWSWLVPNRDIKIEELWIYPTRDARLPGGGQDDFSRTGA